MLGAAVSTFAFSFLYEKSLLHLADADLANFPRRFQVGATTGLEVDAFDLQQPDFPGTLRRLYRHRPHQVGLRVGKVEKKGRHSWRMSGKTGTFPCSKKRIGTSRLPTTQTNR